MIGRALEGLYAFGMGLHRRYWAWRGPKRLEAAVVGVGGLEVGGVGKTPVVQALARWLKDRGVRCGIISRGYGRSTRGVVVVHDGHKVVASAREAGDEPVLLGMHLGVPVVVGQRRYEAGKVMIERFGAEVLVADDLFQHWALARDLDIVVVDALQPLDGGRLLPVGRLREGPQALTRAQALVVARAEGVQQVEAAVDRLGPWAEGLVVAGARFSTWLREPGGGRARAEGLRAVGFCGIGRPDAFRRALEAMGVELADWRVFRDHHYYTRAEMQKLWKNARAKGAVLVTTDKDRVRIPPGEWEKGLWVAGVEVEWVYGWGELAGLIGRLLRGRKS